MLQRDAISMAVEIESEAREQKSEINERFTVLVIAASELKLKEIVVEAQL